MRTRKNALKERAQSNETIQRIGRYVPMAFINRCLKRESGSHAQTYAAGLYSEDPNHEDGQESVWSRAEQR